MKTLLLWDIDGTLISSGGAGARALRRGLHREFAIEGSLDDIDFAGRTDPWIMRQVFNKFNLPDTPENHARFFNAYLNELPRELDNPQACVLPGVRAILAAAASRGNIGQGLLTGNMRSGAEAKLRYHGLWELFSFGAFADDSEHRNELGPHAVRRASDWHRVVFEANHVWVIGDTPHDIACGKKIGARTVGVATGSHSMETLNTHAPTAVMPDLTDTAALMRLFEN